MELAIPIAITVIAFSLAGLLFVASFKDQSYRDSFLELILKDLYLEIYCLRAALVSLAAWASYFAFRN